MEINLTKNWHLVSATSTQTVCMFNTHSHTHTVHASSCAHTEACHDVHGMCFHILSSWSNTKSTLSTCFLDSFSISSKAPTDILGLGAGSNRSVFMSPHSSAHHRSDSRSDLTKYAARLLSSCQASVLGWAGLGKMKDL